MNILLDKIFILIYLLDYELTTLLNNRKAVTLNITLFSSKKKFLCADLGDKKFRL